MTVKTGPFGVFRAFPVGFFTEKPRIEVIAEFKIFLVSCSFRLGSLIRDLLYEN
jgi:hypothetical protein